MIKSEYDVVAKGASIWGVIRNGNVSLLGQMLDADHTLANEPDQYGRVPLFYLAALFKNSGAVGISEDPRKRMIDRLFDTPDINLRAKAGHPATDVSIMSIALSVGDTYLFEKLLDADPTLANEPDQYGRVPRAYLEKMLNSKMECIGVSKGTQHQMLKRLDCE